MYVICLLAFLNGGPKYMEFNGEKLKYVRIQKTTFLFQVCLILVQVLQ